MRVMVFDVPDAVITDVLAKIGGACEREAVGAGGCAPPIVASKPPTQGVVAGMGEQAKVMAPKAPPPGVLRMVKLTAHPWFQEFVTSIAKEEIKTAAGGDSLKLAQLYFGSQVMNGRPLQEWDADCQKRLDLVVEAYEAWATKKGYDLAEA